MAAPMRSTVELRVSLPSEHSFPTSYKGVKVRERSTQTSAADFNMAIGSDAPLDVNPALITDFRMRKDIVLVIGLPCYLTS